MNPQSKPKLNFNFAGPRKQGGFTLIELTVVFLILVVLAVIAVPRIQSLILENKTPTVARETQAAVVRIRGARSSTGTAPYAGLAIAEVGGMLRNTSFGITGTPATAVVHALGSGAAAGVTVNPINFNGTAGANTGFNLIFANVDQAACVPLVSTLSGAAEAIAVGATAIATQTGATATVKPAGGAFNATTAQALCDNPANNIAFVFR